MIIIQIRSQITSEIQAQVMEQNKSDIKQNLFKSKQNINSYKIISTDKCLEDR